MSKMEKQRKTLDVTMMEDFKSQLQNSNVARGTAHLVVFLIEVQLISSYTSEFDRNERT